MKPNFFCKGEDQKDVVSVGFVGDNSTLMAKARWERRNKLAERAVENKTYLICLECGRIYKKSEADKEPTHGIGFTCDCGSDWLGQFVSLDGKLPRLERSDDGAEQTN